MKEVTWNQVNQIWSWYAVFIKHDPIGENHEWLKRCLEETHMKSDPSNMVVVPQPNRRQSLKNTFKKIRKEVQKRLLYRCFDSLIPAVFYAVKVFIFQDSLCCKYIRFHTAALRSASRTPSNIYDRTFCKISQQFFSR